MINLIKLWTLAIALTFPVTDQRLGLVQSAAAQSNNELVGTWEGHGPSDNRAKQHVVLELRSDNTYTKTLDAVVDGKHYGGTHSGEYKARGKTVYLSGNKDWPPSNHDLSTMRKVK